MRPAPEKPAILDGAREWLAHAFDAHRVEMTAQENARTATGAGDMGHDVGPSRQCVAELDVKPPVLEKTGNEVRERGFALGARNEARVHRVDTDEALGELEGLPIVQGCIIEAAHGCDHRSSVARFARPRAHSRYHL